MIKVKMTDSPRHVRLVVNARWTAYVKIILLLLLLLAAAVFGTVWSINLLTYDFSAVRELQGFNYLAVVLLGLVVWLLMWIIKYAVALIRFPKTFSEEIRDALAEITFTEDEMIYTYITLRENTERRYKYGGLCSAEEYEGFFELATKNIKLCVFNDDITEGTPEELRSLLCEKMGEKFTVKIK